MRTSLSSLPLAVIAVIAACTGDAVLTGPLGSPPSAAALAGPIRLVVIDSTRLPFAGTAAERAAGHYAFQIGDSVPTLSPGDYVAGRQGGLFLGRVVAVSQSAGRLVLELAPATWSEVYPPFKMHIPFTAGAGSAPSPYGAVRWGPWRLVSRARPGALAPSAAPAMQLRTATGAVADPTDFNPVNFLLSNFDLCAASGVVTGCTNITAKLIAANFSLTGGVDVGVDINPLQLSLDAHADVTEQLATDADFQLTGTGTVEVDVPIPDAGFVREFSGGGISGKIEVGIIVGVEGDITGTTIEPHFALADTIVTADSLSTADGLKFHYTGAGHFDAGVKVVDLGDLGVKLSIGPKVEVKIDVAGGGGIDLGAGADGFEEAHENLSGLLGFENWHVHVDAGTEATLEGSFDVPLIGSLGGQETFPGPGINLLDLWGTGDLNLTTSTTGKDIFPGQVYSTAVARTNPGEPPPWYAVLSSPLGVNASHLFVGGLLCRQFYAGAPLIPPFIEAPQDCNLVATTHTVDLAGWAWNCSPTEALPATVQVRPRDPFDIASRLTNLTLGVVCRSAYAVVRDRVAALLAAGAINIGGIATALDAKLTAAETARDAGDPAGADSALVDLANQLRAQSGKHITVAADAELQALDMLLRACYETVVPTCSTVPPAAPLALGVRAP